MDGLDLRDFLAPARVEQLEQDPSDDGCTLYDLYATVHHIGALNGGHYVTTVRESEQQSSEDSAMGMTTSVLTNRWRLFNDGVVSPLDPRELCGPTVYLLFYVRRGKLMEWNNVLSGKVDGCLRGYSEEEFEKLMAAGRPISPSVHGPVLTSVMTAVKGNCCVS